MTVSPSVARSARLTAWTLAASAVVAGAVVTTAQAQSGPTVQDGVYTDAQASRGQAIYAKQCASCHGDTAAGLQAPPLVGDAFRRNWRARPLAALAGKIRNTMPADAQGTLSPAQSVDLVAHILRLGGFPAGRAELASTDAALSAIAWPSAPAEAASASTVRAFPPLGNMAQLMRGIFFPNSNLIFTVQTRDPGAPPPKPDPAATGDQTAGFSFVDWGAGIYGGWQLVDNAAIALADASPLMLTPGIRCENGRLAPVTDELWIKLTEQMIAVARKTYQASQTRSQEAVSEATGDLSDACAACHQVYRETRGRGQSPDPTDPSNKAARCMARSSEAPPQTIAAPPR